jgi:predicted enzyme related to lactoylglutathione lyase
VVGFEPIFTVADVARSVDHYQRLGFETSRHDDAYAFAHRNGNLTIHLAQAEEGAAPRSGSIYLHVDDAEQLAEEWRKAGVDVVRPEDFDYGKREGSHTDPDGNLIGFGSPVPRPLED